MKNNYGLKEIRFVNSGFFDNETVDVSNSSLFLGSSGVGKTTILSAATFFYTLDKKITRPDDKERDFIDWHIQTSISYVMYRYTNLSGSILLIIGKESSRAKFIFVDINEVEDIESLYLDSNQVVLDFSLLVQNFIDKGIYFYKAETFPEFRKVLHKDSQRELKSPPRINFTLFRNQLITERFADHLFKIYKNSTVQDSSIKQMLISIIQDSEKKFNLEEFRGKLEKSLSSVELIKQVRDSKDIIEKLDKLITQYSFQVSEEADYIASIRRYCSNASDIISYIDDTVLKSVEKKEQKENKLKNLSSKYESDNKELLEEIAKTDFELKNIHKQQKRYETELSINSLIKEQEQEEKIKNRHLALSSRLAAITSTIENIENVERSRINEVKEKLLLDKEEERESLTEKKDNFINQLEEERENKEVLIEKEISSKELELSLARKELDAIKEEITTHKVNINSLEVGELTSNLIKLIREELDKYNNNLEQKEQEQVRIKEEWKELLALREEKDKKYAQENEDLIEYYSTQLEKNKELIFTLEKKLDLNKSNLFGFLNNVEPKNKDLILSVVSDNFLFEEGIEFKEVDESDTFFGLSAIGNFFNEKDKYDISILKEELQELKAQRDRLVQDQKTKINNLLKNVDDHNRKSSRDIKERVRKERVISDEISKIKNKIQRERSSLEEALEKLREKRKVDLLKLKAQLKILDEKSMQQVNKCKELESGIIKTREEINSLTQIKIDKLKDSILKAKQALNALNSKYKQLENNNIKLIEEEFFAQKKSEGADAALVAKLKKDVDFEAVRLKGIDKNRSDIKTYFDVVIPSINSIPSLRDKLESLRSKEDILLKDFKKDKEIIKKDVGYIDDTLTRYSVYKKDFKKFLESSEPLKLHLHYNEEYLDEGDIENMLHSKEYKSVYDRYQNLQTLIENNQNNIERWTLKLCNDIPPNNILGLKTTNGMDVALTDDINSYIVIAKDYIVYLKEQLGVEGAGLQIKSLAETINAANSQIMHIKGDIRTIFEEITKVNRMISESIKDIKVLDLIKLNYYESDDDNISLVIENLAQKFNKEFHLYFSGGGKEAQEEIDKIVNIAKELKESIKTTSKKFITVNDLSTLSFDVTENGISHKSLLSLRQIGSNGTSILIKTIIYLTLLSKVSKKISHIDGVLLHCILDEIGQISADYFNELLSYTNKLGFNFLNGTAANDDDIISFYQSVYLGLKEGETSSFMDIKKASIFDKEQTNG